MSNIFKPNSRFSSLKDDIVPKKEKEQKKEHDNKYEKNEESFNSFKSERPLRTESNYRGFSDRGRERYRLEREEEIKAQKELEEREKERIRKESLKIENFPDLVVIAKKDNTNEAQTISYIDKLKKEEIKSKNIDEDLEILKPGWVLLKRDSVTGRTIIKNHPENNFNKEEEEKRTEQEIAYDILDALVKLHQRRTDEYIEQYGYDTWEKMFKFPDWREREAYLEEMEEMENITDIDESEEDECY